MEALNKALLLFQLVALAFPWVERAGAGYLAEGPEPVVVINELLASNIEHFADPQGELDDWIELYNPGNTPLDAAGLYLTDDTSSPKKWQIPLGRPAQTTIPPHGYLLIWADRDTADSGLHAGFSLDAGGEELALIDTDGVTVLDGIRFGEQRAGISYGRFPDGSGTWSLLGLPTPNGPNARLYEGFVERPQFSPGHGFYHGTVLVTITCDTPDAVIFYTVDGSDPYSVAANHPNPQASVYNQPVPVSRTACLRAVATRPGWRYSPTQTQTYVFLEDVIRQCPNGQSPGGRWPSGKVNSQVIDYAMDPDVVNDPRYKDLMDDALSAIPSISLVTDLSNLFDPSRGIYVNARQEGRNWERPVSVELIDPNGKEGFQIDAGIRIRGGFSRGGDNPKHSFRLFFRSNYGPPTLKYPLFDSEGADEFENIDLRTAQNYAWSLESFNPGQKNTFVREEFCRDLQRETGQPYTRTRYYHLYINGLYWGLYETQERSEASYASTYFGGEPEDYDVIMTEEHQAAATDGTIAEWNLLWDLCQKGFETDQKYYAVQGKRSDGTDDPALPVRVDLVNLIDYMLGIFYTGNDDAPVTLGSGSQANNFFAIRNRRLETRQGWQFFAYDNEHSLGTYRDVNDDRTGPVTAGQSRQHFNPQWLHQKLMVHPEYRLLFADRTHRHFFNNGVMTPEKAIALCLSRANQIDMAIIGESARWGDQRPSRANNPYTKADWWAEVHGYLIGSYFPARTQIVLNQLRNRGLYPQVNAPVFRINGSYRHGGHITATDALSMTGGGTIWYTLDGSDPRIPGTTAAPAPEITLVAEGASKRVFVPTSPLPGTWRTDPAFDDSGWTAGTGGVGYERSTGYESLFQINVQTPMYSKNASCLIRIPFDVAIGDLSTISSLVLKLRYDDGFVAYLNGSEVVRKNCTGEPAWNARASTTNSDVDAVNLESFSISEHISKLHAGRNLLAIHGLNDSTTSSDFLLSVELTAAKGPADGAPTGVSPTALKYTQPIALKHSACVKARALVGTTWSALNEAVFAVGPVAASLRISEIMYHPDGDPNSEFIELTNVGQEAINLNLVRFTKGIEYTFVETQDFASLPPGGCCLVVKDIPAFEAVYGPGLPITGEYSGSLSNSGERIELQDALGTTIQAFTFDDDWYKLTDGNGYSLTAVDPRGTDPNDWSDKGAWRPSTSPGGSPGKDDVAAARQ